MRTPMMLMLLGMATPAMAGSFYSYWTYGTYTWTYTTWTYTTWTYTPGSDTDTDSDADSDADADTDTDTDVDTADTGGGKDGGCACNTGSEMGGAAGLLLAMGVIGARRRRS